MQSWKFCSASTAATTSACSSIPLQIASMFSHFGNKRIMQHQPPRPPQSAQLNEYDIEEASFKEAFEPVPIGNVPPTANVIGSHVIEKVKMADGNVLSLKARIVPHGSDDCIKKELSSDCSTCSPVGMSVMISTASLHGWQLHQIDVKFCFSAYWHGTTRRVRCSAARISRLKPVPVAPTNCRVRPCQLEREKAGTMGPDTAPPGIHMRATHYSTLSKAATPTDCWHGG